MGSIAFRGAATLAVLVAGLAAAGCGTSSPAGSKPAAHLMPAVQRVAQSAKSVHISGLAVQGAQKIHIDMSFVGRSGVYGTIGANGASVALLSVHGQTYLKIDKSFLKMEKAPATACAMVCGRYIELPAASARQMLGTLSLKGLVNQVFGNKTVQAADASGCVFAPATRDGQQVLECRHGSYTFDVAATGTPYPVRFTGPHGQFMTFSEWNSAVLPAAPPAKDVISLSSLG